MQTERTGAVETIQRIIARLVATSPAGQGLSLIGGFRYRLLNQGARLSMDVDYHWDGELIEKQAKLAKLFDGKLLPEVRRRLGFDGRVNTDANPATASALVRVVDLAFWNNDPAKDRIVIPVDITRIVCLDKPAVRTVDGVVYRTVSDADLVESKITSVFMRPWIEHRDIVDLFLFASHIAEDYVPRVQRKFEMLAANPASLAERLNDLSVHQNYHERVIAEVVSNQLNSQAVENIRDAGGGSMVLDAVMAILVRLQQGQTGRPDSDGQKAGNGLDE